MERNAEMTRFRTTWLAVLGAGLLTTLSISTALGAHPETDSAENHGHQVAAFHLLLHGLGTNREEARDQHQSQEDDLDGATEGDGQEAEQQDEATTDELVTDVTEPGAHGQCVSEVARSDEVGGPNNNHGGAVSQAARETCWQTDPAAGDEGDGTDTPTEVSDGPGNSENRGSHGGGHKNS